MCQGPAEEQQGTHWWLISAYSCPDPAAPSPDPSSPAVWNVPAPSRLVQPLSCSLIHCSCAGAASMAPGATGVPKHLAGDCLASLPARGGGTAPSIRASAASGRRKVSSSPLRDVLMTTGPKAASPPPTEALSRAQAAPRRMSVLAAGSTGSLAGHRAQPFPSLPASLGRNPIPTALWERVDPAAGSHTAGHSPSNAQPRRWQLLLFPHHRERGGSPFKAGGKPPPAPCGARSPAPLAHR